MKRYRSNVDTYLDCPLTHPKESDTRLSSEQSSMIYVNIG